VAAAEDLAAALALFGASVSDADAPEVEDPDLPDLAAAGATRTSFSGTILLDHGWQFISGCGRIAQKSLALGTLRGRSH
jgi:hypothetical protein